MKKVIISIIVLVISGNLFGTTKTIGQVEIQQIFTQLTTVVGDYSQTLPKVVIRPQKRFGASYRRSENTIFIEQAAIDICATFGADASSAIAFLLGHELTHYYQKHEWQETGFLTSTATFQKNIHHEKEADTYSTFLTYLAGYNSVEILPQLLEKIYEAYELKGKTLIAYPSLSERKLLARGVCKTVQGLIDIYQAANYLYALGKYEEALVSYEYLLKYVKYKELYNNIGLCALYTVLPILKRDFPFTYPLTLDATIPLRASGSFAKEILIQKAISNFLIAVTYDESYFLSYLNLACAYDLNRQFKEVKPLLTRMQKLAIESKQEQQITILEGILAFRQGNKILANSYFLEVKSKASFPDLVTIAQININLMNGKQLEKIPQPALPLLEDKIEGINLLFYENKSKETSYILRDRPLDRKLLSIQKLKDSKIYVFYTNEQFLKIQMSNALEQKTKQGIRVNSDITQIELAYLNTTQRLVPHLKGFYLLLPSKGLLFNLNENNKVTEWGIVIN